MNLGTKVTSALQGPHSSLLNPGSIAISTSDQHAHPTRQEFGMCATAPLPLANQYGMNRALHQPLLAISPVVGTGTTQAAGVNNATYVIQNQSTALPGISTLPAGPTISYPGQPQPSWYVLGQPHASVLSPSPAASHTDRRPLHCYCQHGTIPYPDAKQPPNKEEPDCSQAKDCLFNNFPIWNNHTTWARCMDEIMMLIRGSTVPITVINQMILIQGLRNVLEPASTMRGTRCTCTPVCGTSSASLHPTLHLLRVLTRTGPV